MPSSLFTLAQYTGREIYIKHTIHYTLYNVEGGGYLEMNVIAWDPAGDTHKGTAAEEVGRILTLSQTGRKLLKSQTHG